MTDRYARSRDLFARAQNSIAAGVNSGIRRMEQPVPLYFSHGSGPRVWDVDGNEYIDFQIGQGALLYGHAPAGMADAIADQARKGTHWAAQCELEIEVAERLQKLMPGAERIRFNNSATEVVLSALRLARAHTGRPLILKFEGAYHGWADEGLVGFAPPPDKWGDDENPTRLHPSQGVIPEVLDTFVVARWNDPEHLRRQVDRHRGQIAAIIFEPIMCNTCCMEPVPGQIETIRELCDRDGMLMIADETITGLRFGPGGAQQYLGFTPDLTILGKAIGGGVPCAAFGFSDAIAQRMAAARAALPPGHSGIGTTLSANALTIAAMHAMLADVMTPQAYAHMDRLAEHLASGLAGVIARHDLDWHVARVGARVEFVCAARPPRNGSEARAAMDHPLEELIHLMLVNRGSLLAPFHNMMLVSPATTAQQVDRLVANLDAALSALEEDA